MVPSSSSSTINDINNDKNTSMIHNSSHGNSLPTNRPLPSLSAAWNPLVPDGSGLISQVQSLMGSNAYTSANAPLLPSLSVLPSLSQLSKVDLPGNNKLNQSKKARAPEIYGSADKKVIVSKDSIIIDGVTITACAKCRLENNKTAIQCRIQKQCTYPQYKSDNAIVSYSNVSQNQNLGLRPLDNTIDYDSYVPKYKEIAAFLGIKQQPPKPPPKRAPVIVKATAASSHPSRGITQRKYIDDDIDEISDADSDLEMGDGKTADIKAKGKSNSHSRGSNGISSASSSRKVSHVLFSGRDSTASNSNMGKRGREDEESNDEESDDSDDDGADVQSRRKFNRIHRVNKFKRSPDVEAEERQARTIKRQNSKSRNNSSGGFSSKGKSSVSRYGTRDTNLKQYMIAAMHDALTENPEPAPLITNEEEGNEIVTRSNSSNQHNNSQNDPGKDEIGVNEERENVIHDTSNTNTDEIKKRRAETLKEEKLTTQINSWLEMFEEERADELRSAGILISQEKAHLVRIIKNKIKEKGMSAISSEDIEILRGCNIHITLADMIQNSNLNLPAVDDLTTDQHNPTIFDYSKNKPVKIVMICAGSLDERILHPRVAKNKEKNGNKDAENGVGRNIFPLPLLSRVMGSVDLSVQAASEVNRADDYTRMRVSWTTSRMDHYHKAKEVIEKRAKGLDLVKREKKLGDADTSQMNADHLGRINQLKYEEEELLSKLREVRNRMILEDETHKQAMEDRAVSVWINKARSNQNSDDFAVCQEMLNVTERKMNILSAFQSYIKVFIERKQVVSGSIGEVMKSVRSSRSKSKGALCGMEVIYRILDWVNSVREDDEEKEDEILDPYFLRVLHEAVRISALLMYKYDGINILDDERSVEIQSLMQWCGSSFRSIRGEVKDTSHLIVDTGIDVNTESTDIATSTSKKDVLGGTIVLYDVRTLQHKVPRDLPERSLRVVRIMDRLSRLQAVLPEREIIPLVECREANLQSTKLDMFLEAVSLVHSDHYISFLTDRVKKAENVSLGLVPLKEEVIDVDSDSEVEFDLDEELELVVTAKDVEEAALQSIGSHKNINEKDLSKMVRKGMRAQGLIQMPLLKKPNNSNSDSLGSGIKEKQSGPVTSNPSSAKKKEQEPVNMVPAVRFAPHLIDTRRIAIETHEKTLLQDGGGANPLSSADRRNNRRKANASNRLGIPRKAFDSLLAVLEPPEEMDPPNADDRVALWDSLHNRRCAGGSSPFFRNLKESLNRNNHLLLYVGQDGKREMPFEHVRALSWLFRAGTKFGSTSMVPSDFWDNPGKLVVDLSEVRPTPVQSTAGGRAKKRNPVPTTEATKSNDATVDSLQALQSNTTTTDTTTSQTNVEINADATNVFTDHMMDVEKPMKNVDEAGHQNDNVADMEVVNADENTIGVENQTSKSVSDSHRRMPENGEIAVLDSKAARKRSEKGKEASRLITKAEAEEVLAAVDREVLEQTIKNCGNHVLNGRTVRGDLFVEHDDEEEPVCGAGWWDSINSYETDTFVSPGSLEAALAASEVVCHAVDLTVADNNIHNRNSFCCVRPPGHHSGRFGNTTGCGQNGFCLLNNVAVGAMYARIRHGLRRFAVVDIDAHFGNGTAEILESDPHAFYASVHLQYDAPGRFFPSSSCCSLGIDTDTDNMLLANIYPPVHQRGTNRDSRVPRGRGAFVQTVIDRIVPALHKFKPDIIFISAGFDGAHTDPIGCHLGLRVEDFYKMTQSLVIAAGEICNGRIISVLEGGYDLDDHTDGLSRCVEAHVQAMAGTSLHAGV